MIAETYKPISGFENYVVTVNGNVFRLKKDGNVRQLSPFCEYGYSLVCLRKSNGTQYKKRVHRLVAEAFIPNPDNLPYVNHMDENKANNRVDNLEWCTAKYNDNYGSRNDKVSKAVSKPVVGYDDRGYEMYFESITEASRYLKGANRSHISSCCKGKRKTTGGLKWRYAK